MLQSNCIMALKEICKNRILQEMVRPTISAGGYKAMIVDEKTLRILSTCCKTYDILEEGVSVVELITKKRQPLQDLEAIYFISSEQASVNSLIKDFSSTKKRQYKNAHIFLASTIDGESGLMDSIARTPTLLPYIKSFFDFNMNFIAYEQRVFHFDSPSLLPKLYPTASDALIKSLAEKMLCVCTSLQVKPAVRFHSTKCGLSAKFAVMMNHKLKNTPLLKDKEGDATLLIVERSIDLATLLIHEYTYQAFVYDALGLACCVDKRINQNDTTEETLEDTFTYTIHTQKSDSDTKRVLLGEHDEMWTRYRHDHIQNVNLMINEEANKFAKDNPATVMKKETITTEEASRAVQSLPEYQELLSKYWTHVNLGEAAMRTFQEKKINSVALVEQDLSCSIDKDGKEINFAKFLTTFNKVLSDGEIAPDLKLRLLLLYFTQMQNIDESDRKKMFATAELSLESQRCIIEFLKMDLHSMDTSEINESQIDKKTAKHFHRLAFDKERRIYFKNKARTALFDLSRFEPVIKDLMHKCAKNTLSGGLYPYVETPKSSTKSSGASEWTGFSNSGTQWDYALDASSLSEKPSKGNGSTKKTIIIFILGDISFAEMRCAYEVSNALNVDVYIGGTAITTPPQLITMLKQSRTDSSYL